MVNRRIGLVSALAMMSAAFPACEYFEKSPGSPAASPSPTTAVLEITVAPDPLKILWVCPLVDTNCYGSLDSTVTITEKGGVGGRVDGVDFTARDAVLGIALTTLHLSSDDIRAKAGTNRIEALGKLAVRPIVEGYPVKNNIPRPRLDIDVTVELTDDKGNVVKQTKRVPVT
jgi:hypothetical protein